MVDRLVAVYAEKTFVNHEMVLNLETLYKAEHESNDLARMKNF